jgi:peptidoglycan hydrolase-like protein with peptidoglycan-binding domain
LRQGAAGKWVRELQNLLEKAGHDVGEVDGEFGGATKYAVLQFQRRSGLGADGVVGPQTWKALRTAKPGNSNGGNGGQGVQVPGLGASKAVTAYRGGSAYSTTVYDVGQGEYLCRDAALAMMKMKAAAARSGIHLGFNSGFRTYGEQQALWNRYGAGRAAQPGYSNHQQGLSMDINVVSDAVLNWLRRNARSYGFINDVSHEPWHWTYYG